MGYIMNLREKVGHSPLIGVGATTLVFNSKNELLLNLRSDTNNWGIPGGSKELNETLEECAIRELKEETNINVNDLELITVLSGKEYYFKYPNDDELDCVIALYKVSNYDGELNINDRESRELKFYSLDSLPELESRAKTIIDKIKSGIIEL
jgi:ADP-ribose pyrophosphatase YjhB (NUDIX family)